MSLPLQRTLDHLRTELAVRLGYGAQTLTTAQKSLLASFLQTAQEELYTRLADPLLSFVDLSLATQYTSRTDISFNAESGAAGATIVTAAGDLSTFGPGIVRVRTTSGVNDGDYRVSAASTTTLTLWREESLTTESAAAAGTVTLYLYAFPWPDWVDPLSLLHERREAGVSARLDDVTWFPLAHGITVHHESEIDAGLVGYPLRWDNYSKVPGQTSFLRIWPLPDARYPLRIVGYRRLNAFRDNLSTWAASTSYSVGSIVIPTGAPTWPSPLRAKDSFYYECVDAGTSGATEPTWPTEEGALVEENPGANNVFWKAVRNDCTLDQTAVLLEAIARAKAHYRQADAQLALAAANQYLGSLQRMAHQGRRYIYSASSWRPLPRPRRV